MFCHLECSKTKYRRIEELSIGKNLLKLKAADLDGRLQLVALIVADKDLENYYSENFDADYGTQSFFIQKGSILAIADIPAILIENRKENLSGLPSIFDIRQDKENRVMSVDLNENRIIISLPVELFKIRTANNNSLHSRTIMNSMIVFPALVSVLTEMSKTNAIQDYANQRWFAIISKKLKDLEIDFQQGELADKDLLSVAQALLAELFAEAMKSIDYLGDSE
jgi:hypothetical protein